MEYSPESPPPQTEVTHAPKREGILKLNVGGVKFVTTFATLLGCSDDQDRPQSMLSRMFAIGLKPAMVDEEGFFFLDRSGEMFHYVLAHLRDPGTLLLPTSRAELTKLKQEALYYGLQDLEAQVDKALQEVTFTLSVSFGYFEFKHITGQCPCQCRGNIDVQKPECSTSCLVKLDSLDDVEAQKATLKEKLTEVLRHCCPVYYEGILKDLERAGAEYLPSPSFLSVLRGSDISREWIFPAGHWIPDPDSYLHEIEVDEDLGPIALVRHYRIWVKVSLQKNQTLS